MENQLRCKVIETHKSDDVEILISRWLEANPNITIMFMSSMCGEGGGLSLNVYLTTILYKETGNL